MAIPTQPTAELICTEALKRKLNGSTPSSASVTRAEDYGLEKVKRDIMLLGRLWRPLIQTAYDITIDGVSKYANDSDFEEYIGITLIWGDHTGTLTVVTDDSNVTLAADEDVAQENAEGKYLLITGGTGADQCEQIDDYTESTKAVKLRADVSTSLDTTSTYMICDQFRDLKMEAPFRRDSLQYGLQDKPRAFYNYPDSTYGYFELYPVPDAVYGVKKRYFADLLRLDITGTLYTTILRRWAGIFEQGVYAWSLGEDDNRYQYEHAMYLAMLKDLKARELYLNDETNLQIRVED